MSIVVCKLPKAGLGNQLFPLVKTLVFAELNQFPYKVINYNQVKIGPYLRGEKLKRKYRHFFNFEKGIIGEQLDKWSLKKYAGYQIVHEPEIRQLPVDSAEKKQYYFSKIPHWDDYFKGLKENRQLAIKLLYQQVNPAILKIAAAQQQPEIGVHIRMGDFRKLGAGEDFSKVGAVRTPENYFIDIIQQIREITKKKTPVTIFSDGRKEELTNIFKLGNVVLQQGTPDLADLILLSKSKIIVTSAGSTFSYWAGFLSQAPLIMHPDHIHHSLRPLEMANELYEGIFDNSNPVLIKNISTIA